MVNQNLQFKQVRTPFNIRYLLPLVIFWLILGVTFFIVSENTPQIDNFREEAPPSDLNTTGGAADPVPASEQENFDTERQPQQSSPSLSFIIPLLVVLTIFGVLASGILV